MKNQSKYIDLFKSMGQNYCNLERNDCDFIDCIQLEIKYKLIK